MESLKLFAIKLLYENVSLVWWCTPVNPGFGRLRQEDLKFKASLGYIVSKTLSQDKNEKLRKTKIRALMHF